jgi:hypothetical protein
MSVYPVHFEARPVARFTRVQLLVRLVALLALGMIGISLGTLFALAYLFLPIYAASRIASLGSALEYSRQDGPRVLRALHWFVAVSAWAGLAVEALPAHGPEETVRIAIDVTPLRASPVSALLRIPSGLLNACVLALLGCLGGFVWIWGAISIFLREDVGIGARSYLVGLQRWSLRLLAHQACLVDQYPPFSFSDGPPATPTNDHDIVPA